MDRDLKVAEKGKISWFRQPGINTIAGQILYIKPVRK